MEGRFSVAAVVRPSRAATTTFRNGPDSQVSQRNATREGRMEFLVGTPRDAAIRSHRLAMKTAADDESAATLGRNPLTPLTALAVLGLAFLGSLFSWGMPCIRIRNPTCTAAARGPLYNLPASVYGIVMST